MTSGRTRGWWLPRSIPGLIGAAVVWTSGLAPSLLPRPAGIAVALAGLLAAIGYGLGCLVAWIVRRVLRLTLGTALVRGGRALVVGLWLWAVAVTVVATGWQVEQAQLLGMSAQALNPIALIGLGLAVGCVLVLTGRGLRSLDHWAAGAASRRWGAGWGVVTGLAAAVGLVVGVLAVAYVGVLVLFGVLDGRGSGGAAPTSSARSGGPGSLVPYSALGTEGQRYVNGGATPQQITAYTGKPALESIRVYVGLSAATSAKARADLAVQELRRTGAFHRRLLVVAVTTGNGYLDPVLLEAPEFLTSGDIATVATQYSVLPSWLSFLVDQKSAGAEAQALWQAVRHEVDTLPADQRPILASSGESLGAFGAQTGFDAMSPEQVADQADAVVWVGSPGASPLWTAWRDSRAGGPAWEPVIGDSSIARNPATSGSDLWTATGWDAHRIVLTQHANDPVSWWSPDLIWRRPEWLEGSRGPGVDPRITWWPGILFVQTGLDLAAAGSVPAGVGHNYGDVTALAWAAALHAPGAHGTWATSDTSRLDDSLRRA